MEIDASLPQGMFAPRECVRSGSKGTGHKAGSSPQDQEGWGVRSALVLCSIQMAAAGGSQVSGDEGLHRRRHGAHSHASLTSPLQTRGAPPPAPGPRLSLTAPRARGQRSRLVPARGLVCRAHARHCLCPVKMRDPFRIPSGHHVPFPGGSCLPPSRWIQWAHNRCSVHCTRGRRCRARPQTGAQRGGGPAGRARLWSLPTSELGSGGRGSVEQTALRTQKEQTPSLGFGGGGAGTLHWWTRGQTSTEPLCRSGCKPGSPACGKADLAPRITPLPGRDKENSTPKPELSSSSSFYWQIYFYEGPKKIYIIVTYVHQLYRFYFKFTQCWYVIKRFYVNAPMYILFTYIHRM